MYDLTHREYIFILRDVHDPANIRSRLYLME